MIGRCGRPGYDKHGEAIVIANNDGHKDKIHEKYILGEPEKIESKLAAEPALRTYLLSLIATGYVNDLSQIFNFFKKTFWAFNYGDIEKLESIIHEMLSLLTEWNFLECSSKQADNSGFQSASDYGKESYTATPIGKRIAELYIDPYTASNIIECLKRANENTKSFPFLQALSYTIEMKPLLSVRSKDREEVEQTLLKHSSSLLMNEPSEYDFGYENFVKSIKTAMMLYEWINEKDEETLLEEFGIRPGEIRVKLERADWLIYCAGELSKLLNLKPIIKELIKVRLRLKYGVREQLLPLVRLEGIGRARARKLYFHNIRDLGDVRKAELSKLTSVLGKKIGEDVKRQVSG
jgi:helicase